MLHTVQSESNRLHTIPEIEPAQPGAWDELNAGCVRIEDGKLTNFNYQKFKTLDVCFFILSFIGTGLTVIVYEMIHYETNFEERVVILWVIFLSTILTIIVAFIRTQVKLNWKMSQGHSSEGTLQEKIELILEIFVAALAPLPFVEDIKITFYNSSVDAEVYYYVNEILCLTVAMRSIYYIRSLLLNSFWHSNRTQRICSLYASEANYMFTVKSMMRKQPFLVNYSAMIFLIIVFGYSLRICESPLSKIDDSSNDFSSYPNSMWTVIVTSTTLGYGDYFPRTDLGKFVMTIVCILGNFVVSSMIVIITNESLLSSLENKVVTLIDRLTLKHRMRECAARIITTFARMHYARKYLELDEEDYYHLVKDMRHYSVALKLAVRQYVAAQTLGSHIEEIYSGFNSLKENFKGVYQMQEELILNNQHTLKKLENINNK